MVQRPPNHTLLPKSIPNRELLQRVSYTYQANVFLNSLGQRSIGSRSEVAQPQYVPCPPVNNFEEEEEPEVQEVAESSFQNIIVDGGHEAESSAMALARNAAGTSASVKQKVRFQDGLEDSAANRKALAIGRRQGKALQAAARKSSASYKQVLKHNVLKTDPGMKRSICKQCDTILIPGLTARVRVKPSASHFNKVVTTCLTCTSTRTIPAPPLIPPSSSSTIPQSAKRPPEWQIVPSSMEEEKEEEEEGTLNGSVMETSRDPGNAASLQSAPTATLPRSKVDGPNRAARRAKVARPVPFWQREAEAAVPADSEWLVQTQTERVAKERRNGEGCGRGKGKGGKGSSNGDRPGRGAGVGTGHTIWAGDRAVSNWGVGG